MTKQKYRMLKLQENIRSGIITSLNLITIYSLKILCFKSICNQVSFIFSFVWLIDFIDLIICLVFNSFDVTYFLFLTAPFRDHLCDILSLLTHDDGQKIKLQSSKWEPSHLLYVVRLSSWHTNSKLDFQLWLEWLFITDKHLSKNLKKCVIQLKNWNKTI